jgi:5S rRNA maturation endonuclease (ribonuclease M5)
MQRNEKKDIDPEKLSEVVEELVDKVIIVEGKNDRKALLKMGLHHIIPISGRPLHEVAEEVGSSSREVVILTDFDREGRAMDLKLKSLLQKYKKAANSRLRMKTMNLGKTKIEDLGNSRTEFALSKSLKGVDDYVKVSTDFNKVRNKGNNKCERSNRKT